MLIISFVLALIAIIAALLQVGLANYWAKGTKPYKAGRRWLLITTLLCGVGPIAKLYYDANGLSTKYNQERILDRAYKENMIRSWRQYISRLDDEHSNQGSFLGSVEYSQMRPFLSQETIDSLENNKITVRLGRGGDLLTSLVLDDISKLERKWGLLKGEGLR